MRRSGRTTRLVDEAIQYLFKNNEIILYTNFDRRSNFLDPDARLHNLPQQHFVNTFIKRLELEHYGQFEVFKSKNSNKIEIKRI